MLAEAVEQSFNCISVDSDQSTSDTAAIVSSGVVPFAGTAEAETEFRAAVGEVGHSISMQATREYC